MKTAVLFSNTGVLDFLELRTSIVRIPEVIAKLKEAQVFLDRAMDKAPDLIQFVTSDDQKFWSSEKLRKIAVGSVQLALYERYVKKFGEASHFLAINSEDSPVQVLTGKMRLGEYIINLAMKEDENLSSTDNVLGMAEGMQLSKGISMPDFQLFKASKNEEGLTGYEICNEGKSSALHKLLMSVRDESAVKRFVNIGPGQSISGSAMNDLQDKELNVMESIDLDPMLNWFWDVSSDYSFQVAN